MSPLRCVSLFTEEIGLKIWTRIHSNHCNIILFVKRSWISPSLTQMQIGNSPQRLYQERIRKGSMSRISRERQTSALKGSNWGGRQITPRVCKVVGKLGLSSHCQWGINWCSLCGEQFGNRYFIIQKHIPFNPTITLRDLYFRVVLAQTHREACKECSL